MVKPVFSDKSISGDKVNLTENNDISKPKSRQQKYLTASS